MAEGSKRGLQSSLASLVLHASIDCAGSAHSGPGGPIQGWDKFQVHWAKPGKARQGGPGQGDGSGKAGAPHTYTHTLHSLSIWHTGDIQACRAWPLWAPRPAAPGRPQLNWEPGAVAEVRGWVRRSAGRPQRGFHRTI